MNAEILISDPLGKSISMPAVEEGIEWRLERAGVPGILEFKVVNDGLIAMDEGFAVQLHVDGIPVFFGFVFKQQRTKEQIVTVTAYDQLRYFKNKDTYVYRNWTATQLIQAIAADFNLNTGDLEDTGFVIPSRREQNMTLFDMVGSALDLTLMNTKEMFVLFDDFGKLALKNIANMYVGGAGGYLAIDAETGENFEYSTSIDDNTYNKVKLAYENEETGKRDVYIAQHGENMNRWGILQYFDTLQKGENGQAKADALLQLYNKKTRNLKITNAFGDIRVRAGSLVLVNLSLGDMAVQNFMLVEKVAHKFDGGGHWMDLTLRGGEFVA